MINPSKINTLVLFAKTTDKLSYYDDWEDAFRLSTEFKTTALNIVDQNSVALLEKSIRQYEFIVLLHSTNGWGTRYIEPYKDILRRRRAKLLAFVGNEVNLPYISMREKIEFIRDIEAEFIGTQLPLEAGEWLFAECEKSKIVALPHALNSLVFKPVVPQEARPIDIGFRSNRYLPHLGDNDREAMVNFFSENKFRPRVVLDISMDSRFNREGWAAFLNECKGTISNEAGTYYLEKDDLTVRRIQEYIEKRAGEKKIRIIKDDSQLPAWWRILPSSIRKHLRQILRPFGIVNRNDARHIVGFDEIFDVFYKDYKKPHFYSKGISSRHFDAIGTKTCQIMFEGRFNDILKADEHYIALRRDFSNIDDVIRRFRDISYRKAMVDRAYDYIAETNTYAHRLKTIMDLLL